MKPGFMGLDIMGEPMATTGSPPDMTCLFAPAATRLAKHAVAQV